MTAPTDALIERLRATEQTTEWHCDWPDCDNGYEGNRYCRKCHGEPVRPAETVLRNPDGPEAADRIESLEARIEAAEKVISEQAVWLTAAIECEDFAWSPDQQEAAEYALRAAAQWQAGLNVPAPPVSDTGEQG